MGISGKHQVEGQEIALTEADLELVEESRQAAQNNNSAEKDDEEAVSGVHHSTLETRAQINYQLRPLVLSPGELYDHTGTEILEDHLGSEAPVMIKSGEAQQVVSIMKFHGKPMIAISTPGLPNYLKNGRKNTSGLVVRSNSDKQELTAMMFNGLNNDLDDAALVNAAAVTSAYDLSRPVPLRLEQILQHANRMVRDQKEEINLPAKHVAALGLQLVHREGSSYELQVLGAGDIHCLVINPQIKRCKYTPLQTVYNRLQSYPNIPRYLRDKILAKYSAECNIPLDRIESTLLQSLGLEEFSPVKTVLEAGSGEILVMASGSFIRSFGGTEYFQDGNFSKIFLSEYFRCSGNLYKACQHLTERVSERQQKGSQPDRSFSLIGVEIP